LTEEEKRK
jgi:hypothetical protein